MTTFAEAAPRAFSPSTMSQGNAAVKQPQQQAENANTGKSATSTGGDAANGVTRSSHTSHGFVPPPKGYFSPTPTKTTTAINRGFPTSTTTTTAVSSNTRQSNGASEDTVAAANNANENAETRSVSRPRRESLGQMRRKASDSATAAASAGGIGIAFAQHRGQPIPANRNASRGLSSSPRFGAEGANGAPFSTSLGSAAEALSLPASVLNSGAKSGRSTGHTHFGKECFGPEPGENIPNPPSSLVKGTAGATPASMPNGGADGSAESVAGDDDENLSKSSANGKELPIHRCESCSKIYRHPSCLIKHRWEHTSHWKEASKFLMSKHQQVQLLEAAAILVNLDGDSASLPDEKALWPAAVSPATSGLLGSDKVNFDRLMERKVARRGRASSTTTESVADSSFDVGSLPSTANAGESPATSRSFSVASSSMPRSPSSGMSPLNSFSRLGLSGTPIARPSNGGHPHSFSSTSTGGSGFTLPFSSSYSGHQHSLPRFTPDLHHFTLDESDERTTVGAKSDSNSQKANNQSVRNGGSGVANGSFSGHHRPRATSSAMGTISEKGVTAATPAMTNGSGTSGTSGSSSGASVSGGRSGSADTTDDDDDDDILMVGGGDDDEEGDGVSVSSSAKMGSSNGKGSSVGSSKGGSEKKWGLHEDAVAEMDMDE